MEPASHSIAGAFRLNGVIWLSMVLLYLAAFSGGRSETSLLYLLLILGVAGVGMLINLGLSLWKYATDRHQALPYLLASLPLAGLNCWLWFGLQHIGKMGG